MRAGRTGCVLLVALVISSSSSSSSLGADDRAAPTPAPTFLVAKPVPRIAGGPESERLPSLTVSDGWGCASFDSERGRIRQCWDAGPNPRAWVVPFLKDRIFVAHDRWCEHDVSGLTFRCWQRPRRGDRKAREMPPRWQWLNPHHAGWDDVYSRGDRLDTAFMGGTFACLRTTKDQGVFCLGDDRFGQLGSSAPPGPDAGTGDPAFVRGLGREVAPALGTWHGCALDTPRGMDDEIPVVCWGRGDHGQLGAPAPDKCLVDGHTVPCARTPIRGPRVSDQMAVLGAGDLFTCVTTSAGIKCWGANRDGLFGVRGSCPASLRRAWPTPDGPVPAPNAACTATPVDLPGTTGFDPHFTVLPRRICYESSGEERCLSGVPKPRDPKIAHYEVSPGSDASACALRGESVVCWGEKYSPPGALDKPVTIAFQPLPRLGDMAIIDGKNKRGNAKCQSGRVCPNPTQKLPPCRGVEKARPASEILVSASSLAGQIVRARGPLGVGELLPPRPSPAVGGGNRDNSCGRWQERFVVIGAGSGALALVNFYCSGDDSRLCCNAAAYGQTVVATGRLERDRDEDGRGPAGWHLADATVCEEKRRTNRRSDHPSDRKRPSAA